MKSKIYDVVILAAGMSRRFHSSKPKQFIKIYKKNLVDISVEKFNKIKPIRNIYLVLHKNHDYRVPKKFPNVFKITGGSTRTKSVYQALKYIDKLTKRPDKLLIHDVARPCVKNSEIIKLINQSKKIMSGLSLGYPLTNALKEVNNNLSVIKNLKRTNMFISFTPQVFDFSMLFKAYAGIIKRKLDVDDDVEAMTLFKYKVKMLKSSPSNIKITYKEDIDVVKDYMRET